MFYFIHRQTSLCFPNKKLSQTPSAPSPLGREGWGEGKNATNPKPYRWLATGVLAILSFLASGESSSQHARAQGKVMDQRLLAPELIGGVGWLGTNKPIQLKDLRGKIVVLDFWTLC